jgi:hypothetical protein
VDAAGRPRISGRIPDPCGGVFNGDSVINVTDLVQFRNRFGVILPSLGARREVG